MKFISAFPDVHSLANASEEEVLKLWQGLGYYSRARNLHFTAQYISTELKGVFPNNYKELLKLKGVGEYTAAAIASIAFNENIAVVDGNVFRVLARYFGIENDISKPQTKKEFQKLANSLLPRGKAAEFNQALMEFGALQCVPQNPVCKTCIFIEKCDAFVKQKVTDLPYKSYCTKIQKKYLNYIVIRDNQNYFVVEQRTTNEIWKNLYQFPLIKTKIHVSIPEIVNQIKKKYDTARVRVYNETPIIHKLSHQHLYIRFFEIELAQKLTNSLSLSELKVKPFPIVIYNFIETTLN